MARPEQNLWLPGRTDDLKLEKDFARKNRRTEDERASWRIVEFEWRLIRFRRDLIEDLEQFVADFRAGQSEMLAHVVVELALAIPVAPFRLRPGDLDRLIRRVSAKKPLLENLIAPLRLVACEMPLPVQPLSIGDPAVPEVVPAEGIHPSHLHGII